MAPNKNNQQPIENLSDLVEALATRILWHDNRQSLCNERLDLFEREMPKHLVDELIRLNYEIAMCDITRIFQDIGQGYTELASRVVPGHNTYTLISKVMAKLMNYQTSNGTPPYPGSSRDDNEADSNRARTSHIANIEHTHSSDNASSAGQARQSLYRQYYSVQDVTVIDAQNNGLPDHRPNRFLPSSGRSSVASEMEENSGNKARKFLNINDGKIRQSPASKLFNINKDSTNGRSHSFQTFKGASHSLGQVNRRQTVSAIGPQIDQFQYMDDRSAGLDNVNLLPNINPRRGTLPNSNNFRTVEQQAQQLIEQQPQVQLASEPQQQFRQTPEQQQAHSSLRQPQQQAQHVIGQQLQQLLRQEPQVQSVAEPQQHGYRVTENQPYHALGRQIHSYPQMPIEPMVRYQSVQSNIRAAAVSNNNNVYSNLNDTGNLALSSPQPDLSASDVNQAYAEQLAELMIIQKDCTGKAAELRRRYLEAMEKVGAKPIHEDPIILVNSGCDSSKEKAIIPLKSSARKSFLKHVPRSKTTKSNVDDDCVAQQSSTDVSRDSSCNFSEEDRPTTPLSKQQVIMVSQPTIRTIYSKHDDIVDWFADFEKIANAQRWNRSTMAAQAPLSFKEHAESVWKRLSKTSRNDYELMKSHMLKSLKCGGEDTLMSEYNNLSQLKGETPAQLADRLLRLVERSVRLKKHESEKKIACTFVKALRIEVGQTLINTKFKNLDEALKQSERTEEYLCRKQKEEQHYFSVNAIAQNRNNYQDQFQNSRSGYGNTSNYQYQNRQQPNYGFNGSSPSRLTNDNERIFCNGFKENKENVENKQYSLGQREQTFKIHQRSRSPNMNILRTRYKCLNCQSEDHLVRQCPQVNWSSLRDVVCGYCFRTGHNDKLCVELSNRKAREAASKEKTSNTETAGSDRQSPSH